MYEPLTQITGVESVHEFLSSFTVNANAQADGLIFAVPEISEFKKNSFLEKLNTLDGVSIPNRLQQWLLDLRLLRHVPLAYYIPDAALLPAESIRFFYLDATWMDRVIDGVFSAANTGTVAAYFGAAILALARQSLDEELRDIAHAQDPGSTWDPATGQITGMLIRSELTRRWPTMVIDASTTPKVGAASVVPVLRAEAISKDLYIVLFAGVPDVVNLREANVGVRFGIEPNKTAGGAPYTVDSRDTFGQPSINPVSKTAKVPVDYRDAGHRTLNIAALALLVSNNSRMVALHLEQRPYVQVFRSTVEEQRGSRLPDSLGTTLPLRKGRFSMSLDVLKARYAEQQALTSPKKNS